MNSHEKIIKLWYSSGHNSSITSYTHSVLCAGQRKVAARVPWLNKVSWKSQNHMEMDQIHSKPMDFWGTGDSWGLVAIEPSTNSDMMIPEIYTCTYRYLGRWTSTNYFGMKSRVPGFWPIAQSAKKPSGKAPISTRKKCAATANTNRVWNGLAQK